MGITSMDASEILSNVSPKSLESYDLTQTSFSSKDLDPILDA